MVSTNWSNGSVNSTNYKGNPDFDDEVVRLNSTTVALNSSTVTLLGYTAGRNMINTSPSTNTTSGSVNSTNFTNGSINSTNFTPGSVNSTNWG